MAVFLCKTIQQDENTVSFTYRFKIPGEPVTKEGKGKTLELKEESREPSTDDHPKSTPVDDFDRVLDPNFDFTDPTMLEHCDEILRRAERFNDSLRLKYGIVPDQYVVDNDIRPRFLRTPDKFDESDITHSGSQGTTKGMLRPPYTPYPSRTNRETRDAARMVVRNLANPESADEKKYRVTSTISSIAGKGRPFNPIRLVRSDPEVSRASTIVTRSDIVATRATSSSSCLASNLISLTHTGSSLSGPNMNARSSSAHSRLTPQGRLCSSPTISDIIRFRNRIGMLSDFLRNPRHKPPEPVVRSDSEASTQRGAMDSSPSEH